MKRKWIAVALCAVLVTAAGCGSGSKTGNENSGGSQTTESAARESTQAAEKTNENTYTKAEHESGKYYIGILQQADHGSLNEAANGFQDEIELLMGQDVVCDYRIADGTSENMNEIVGQFVADEDDMILAEGTGALQAAGAATEDIPIVGAAVTDFIIAGGVSSVNEPGGNITGISDLPPMQSQAEAVEALAAGDDGKVGIVYCSEEPNSEFQARLLEEYLDDAGCSWKEYRFSSADELQSVMETACGECGVLYLPADNSLAQHMDIVKEVSVSHKTKVFTSDKAMCEAGGLMTLSVDYYVLGQRCADEAYNIIRYNSGDSSSLSSTSSTGSTETKEEIAAREEAEADAEEEGDISKIAIDRVRDTMAGWYNPEVAEAIGYTPYGDYTAIDMSSSDAGGTGSSGTAADPESSVSDNSSAAEYDGGKQ